MTDTPWHGARDLLRERTRHRANPVRLTNGATTAQYLDIKGALSTGLRMGLAAEALIDHIENLGLYFTAIGGPTMGADVLSHAVAVLLGWPEWFSVRDQPKDHGLGLRIEGARLHEKSHVLLIDDVVSTGRSLAKAYDEVSNTGSVISAVVPFVDRGDSAQEVFADVPYHPMLTYKDLEIPAL